MRQQFYNSHRSSIYFAMSASQYPSIYKFMTLTMQGWLHLSWNNWVGLNLAKLDCERKLGSVSLCHFLWEAEAGNSHAIVMLFVWSHHSWRSCSCMAARVLDWRSCSCVADWVLDWRSCSYVADWVLDCKLGDPVFKSFLGLEHLVTTWVNSSWINKKRWGFYLVTTRVNRDYIN